MEKLHDLEVEEGDQLTLECQSPYSKISTDTKCTAPSFITKLQDDEVSSDITTKTPYANPMKVQTSFKTTPL